MLTNLANPDTLILVGIGLSSLLVIVRIDKLFTRRRSFAVNAAYAQDIYEGRKDSRLHNDGFGVRSRPNVVRDDLIMGPEIEVQRPGFFSNRRVVTDVFGRVVATHYEEIVVNDPKPRLLLTA
jgi:hypothetical protein